MYPLDSKAKRLGFIENTLQKHTLGLCLVILLVLNLMLPVFSLLVVDGILAK